MTDDTGIRDLQVDETTDETDMTEEIDMREAIDMIEDDQGLDQCQKEVMIETIEMKESTNHTENALLHQRETTKNLTRKRILALT